MHFKVHSKYFYSKLDSHGQKAYNKILDAWLDYKESVTISGVTGKVNFGDIVRYVYDDNPELFYVDYNSVSIMHAPFSSIVSMKLLYDRTQAERMKQQMFDVVSKVEKMCKPNLDKEKIVHDFLVQNVRYASDFYDLRAHGIEGALIDGFAVCEGYARAFKLLCDAVEIPCIMISGSATDSNGITESHAWNIVRRNKRNYHVDVTWNCGSHAVSEIPLYYNVPDEYIARNHFWEKNIWPHCDDSSEIDKQIIPVIGKKSLRDALLSSIKEKRKACVVRFNKKFDSTQDVMDLIEEVLGNTSANISSFSSVYVSALDCAIVGLYY